MNGKVQVQLSPDTALVFHQRKPSSKQSEKLQRVLNELGISLQPVHPGIEDPILIPFFEIEISDTSSGQQIIERLNELESVEAAYIKPRDEAP
jgi:hypothetical protein